MSERGLVREYWKHGLGLLASAAILTAGIVGENTDSDSFFGSSTPRQTHTKSANLPCALPCGPNTIAQPSTEQTQLSHGVLTIITNYGNNIAASQEFCVGNEMYTTDIGVHSFYIYPNGPYCHNGRLFQSVVNQLSDKREAFQNEMFTIVDPQLQRAGY